MDLRARSVGASPSDSLTQVSPDAELCLLGGFELRMNERAVLLPMTAKRLLVFVALRRRPSTRTYVSQSLWPESTERHADGNLRSALWRIARLGGSLIDARGGLLALGSLVAVDLHHSAALAERLIDDSRSVDEAELDETELSEDILPDWYDEWVLAERERYRQLRLHGLERLCERLVSLRSFGHAVQAGLSAVAGEPLRESANVALIAAYMAEGNAGEAIRQYRSFCKLLRGELGVNPTGGMRRLVTELGEH